LSVYKAPNVFEVQNVFVLPYLDTMDGGPYLSFSGVLKVLLVLLESQRTQGDCSSSRTNRDRDSKVNSFHSTAEEPEPSLGLHAPLGWS